jgi:hypothetical protein
MDPLARNRQKALLRSARAGFEKSPSLGAPKWTAPDPAPKASLGWASLAACSLGPACACAPFCAALGSSWLAWLALSALGTAASLGAASAWACSRSNALSRQGRLLVGAAALAACGAQPEDASAVQELATKISRCWRGLRWSDQEFLTALEASAESSLRRVPHDATTPELLIFFAAALDRLQASQDLAWARIATPPASPWP